MEILPEDQWSAENIQEQYLLIARALDIAQQANDPTMRRHYYEMEGRAGTFMKKRGQVIPTYQRATP